MTGVHWIAAALAPYAVAPHPNFSVKQVQAVELMALAADLRLTDFDRYRKGIGEGVSNSSLTLVDAVRDSLLAQSQIQALTVLEGLLTEGDLPLGARCACALFISVGASELDELERALTALDLALQQVTDGNTTETSQDDTGSRWLVQAALMQNKVLRLIEANRYEEARELAEQVQQVAPGGKASFERFETSKGVALSSRQVQLDISAALKSHALAARSRLQGLEGSLWTQVVRQRIPYLSSRTDLKALRASGALVKEHFDQRFAATVQRRHIPFGDPVDTPISATLLHEELIGDVNGVGVDRELLGRTRALKSSEWSLSEAVRLLRQAEARQPLGDVLRWIRADGPADVLRGAATHILQRQQGTPITRSDVMVVSSSAELLTDKQLDVAIRLVDSYRSLPGQRLARETSAASWVATQVSWEALSRLLPGSGLDDSVASTVRSALDVRAPGSELYGPLVEVVSSIDWDNVSDSQCQSWLQWVEKHRSSEQYPVNSVILDEIRGVGRHVDVLDRPTGLELGVRIAFEHAHGIEPPESEVRAVSATCRSRLDTIRRSAAEGSFGFGGINAAELSAAMISEFKAFELWEPLGAFLADPKVNGSDKAPALDRLTRDFDQLPDDFLGQFKDVNSLIHVRTVDPFEQESLPISGAALRFLASFGLSRQEDLMDGLAQLAGIGRVDAKVEAARSVRGIAAKSSGDAWAWILLLQLSHDTDPVVRGEAGRALAASQRDITELKRPVTRRLVQLLQSRGILLPLLVIKGLEESSEVSTALLDVVARVSRSHLARTVRKAASELIARS